jgi:serpin B
MRAPVADAEVKALAPVADAEVKALAPVADAEVKALAARSAAFGWDLYARLRKSEKGKNIFVSPYSIATAMAMCQDGAKGNTEKELARALHFSLAKEKLHPAFQKLARDLQATSDVKLRIANGLALTSGEVREEFKTLLHLTYDAELFNAGDVGPINAWVKSKTEGKIPTILEELNPNSVAVILNAIYFKGNWLVQFDPTLTQEQPFKLGAGKEVSAPFMYRKGWIKLMETPGFQAVELSYKGDAFSMVVLLPKKIDGLPELEKSLNAENLKAWIAGLEKSQKRKIELYLPKFKLETEYNLTPTFQRLGVKDAFQEGKADFSGMGGTPGRIYVGEIVHKAFVEVNEEGTEAAAATAWGFKVANIEDRPPEFRADHPFLFLIRHKPTSAVLFVGRLLNPNPSGTVTTGHKYRPSHRSADIEDIGSLYDIEPGSFEPGSTSASASKRHISGVVRCEAPVVGGEMDPALVSKVARREIGAVKACYERELKRDPDLRGKVMVQWTITAAGTVSGVDATDDSMGDLEVEGCITRLVAHWRFPAPAHGSVEVKLTFVFAPFQ